MRPASTVEPAAALSYRGGGGDGGAAPPQRTSEKCDVRTCPWWPYSNSKDFKINTVLIIVILFFALLGALGINAAIRYLLSRRRNRREPDGAVEVDIEAGAAEHKEAAGDMRVVVPTMMFSAETKLKLAGTQEECIICLSEFVEGDKIRVLDGCKHGFHVHCIQKWFLSHSTCPTCRTPC